MNEQDRREPRGLDKGLEWLEEYTREARRERGQCEECGDPAEEEIRGELLCADCASAYHPLPDEYDGPGIETPEGRDRDAGEKHGPAHPDPSGEE